MRSFLRFTPISAIALAGCLATKDDIRLIQDQLTSMRTQEVQQAQAQAQTDARADAVRKAQLDSLLLALKQANDSLQKLSARFANYQATTSAAIYDMGQQLLQIGERTGMNQHTMQDIKARMDERAAESAPPPVPGDSSAKPVGPGPDQMFVLAKGQLDRGSYVTGRETFLDLIQRYPAYSDLPAAVYYIGRAYDGEGNMTAADSVYQVVFTKYPTSPDAPTALYKHAQILQGRKKTAEARSALLKLMADYPKSEAAGLARDLLATLPK